MSCNCRHLDITAHTHLSDGGSESSCSNYVAFSKANMREGLVKYIVRTEKPFSFAEDIQFETFIKSFLNRDYCSDSKNSIRDYFLRVFNEMKHDLIEESLNFGGTISLTLALHTSSNKLDFVCVNAHFIDSDYELQKRTIGFRLIEYPRNATNIFECVMTIFREYEVVDKIVSVTFDDHIYDSGIIEMFRSNLNSPRGGQLFHRKCISQVINLMVQDGLKLIEVQLKSIRDAILFIVSSLTRQEEFFELCKTHGLETRNLNCDIGTRWDSTFFMLKSCVKYDEVITDFVNGKCGQTLVSEKDWEIAFVFMEFLEIFYDAINDFSATYRPSCNIIFNNLYDISFIFQKYREKSGFTHVCAVMETKIKQYFEEIQPNFCLPPIMDPRLRLRGLEYFLNGISENLCMPLHISISDVNSLLTSVYSEYKSKFAKNEKSTFSPPRGSDEITRMFWQLNHQKKSNVSPSSSLLVEYLNANFNFYEKIDTIDILGWWKGYEIRFPILSIMARDLLTPPVSTLSSESAFSVDCQILENKKSKLSPEILGHLVCMKDWEDAQDRAQDGTNDMFEYFLDLDNSGECKGKARNFFQVDRTKKIS